MKQTKMRIQFLLLTIVLVSCAAFKEAPLRASDHPSSEYHIVGGGPASSNLTEEQIRKEVVNLGEQYQGLAYRSGGKEPNTGFDCSGFTGYLFRNFDINLSANSGSQIEDGKPKKLQDVEPGDLIFFSRSDGGRIFHVAMVVSKSDDGITVIHSTNSNGIIKTNINKDEYWSSKIAGARDVISK
jgi:cell wall-associated NlpC family hydrolase